VDYWQVLGLSQVRLDLLVDLLVDLLQPLAAWLVDLYWQREPLVVCCLLGLLA
jgi:hypothetical protein